MNYDYGDRILEISDWLSELGLEQYAEVFEINAIDADALALLSDGDLKELGVAALGHRRKLQAAIGKLNPAAAAALVGTRVDDEALNAAATACSEASSPITDKRGTADYRRKVVGVLCRRAGAIARDRALA